MMEERKDGWMDGWGGALVGTGVYELSKDN